MREFTKFWGFGKRARIFVESVNGGAFVSFSTFLGNPGDPHFDPRKSKMAARTSGHPEGHHDSQNGGNPHFQATSKKKSKRKTERDNARAAEFQKKKKKEDAAQVTATGKEKTARKEEEEEETKAAKEDEEIEGSEMTISSLDSSPESRKFSFASPVPEILRHDTSLDIYMIPDDEKDKTRQDETEYQNDGNNDKVDKDKVDEDKVDSLNDFKDENDYENVEDNLEGFGEDFNDNYGDVEEDQEPGKDLIPEPPPPPPLYRPPRPPIRLSFLGTTSFERRTGNKGNNSFSFGDDRSVFRLSELWILGKILYYSNTVDRRRKIIGLKKQEFEWHTDR